MNKDLLDVDIVRLLESAAHDPKHNTMYLYDDVAATKEYPPHWESAIIKASQLDDVASPYQFLYFCAKMLVHMKSQWPELPQLLERLLELNTGILELELVYQFVHFRKGKVPDSLAQLVKHKYRNLPAWHRCLLKLDGHVRQVLRLC